MSNELSLIFSICSEINNKVINLIKEYHLGFYENFRSNPLMLFDEYLYNTVNYGKYLNNKHNLLFGGELDLINNNPDDIIIISCLWRYFNVLNDVEFKKIQIKYPEDKLLLNTNYGIKYTANYRGLDGSFDRMFDSISSPFIFNEIIDYLNIFHNLNFIHSLYNRFEFFGFLRYYNTLNDNEMNSLIEESISKKQLIYYDIGKYSSIKAKHLNSILDYFHNIECDYPLSSPHVLYDNIVNQKDILKRELKKKYQRLLQYAFINHYPILYSTKS